MKVSDWHILPILETSLQFFSSSSGHSGENFFENELALVLALNFSPKRHSGTINKHKKSLIRG